MNKDKITFITVDLGIDVEDEVKKSLHKDVSQDTIEDAKEILDKLADKPGVKKIEADKKLEEICQVILSAGKISKEKLTELSGKNTISTVGSLRGYAKKAHNKALVKKGEDYVLEDLPQTTSPS